MKGCETIERWISAYGDGELSKERQAALQQHIARCSRCRVRLAEMERLHGVLGSAFALPVEPDKNLPDLVMSALARDPHRPVRRPSLRPVLTLWRTPALAAAALASMAAFTMGLRPWQATDSPYATVAQAPAPPSPVHPASSRSSVPAKDKQATKARLKSSLSTSHRIVPKLPPISPKPSLSSYQEDLASPAVSPVAPPAAAPIEKSVADSPRKVARVNKPSPAKSPGKPGEQEGPPVLASARLQQVAGVALTRDDDTGCCNIPPDTAVRVDQRVRSGLDSRVALALGGMELRMNEETEVVPVRSPQADSPYWVVRLISGEVFARVPKGKYGLKVLTPAGDAVSKEGEFIVRANDLFETRLLIAKGTASLENEGGKSPGFEGMQISSRLGAAPDLAQPSPGPDAFAWAYAPLHDNPFHSPG